MSERILKALMQLFAIIARVDGVNNTGRDIVQSFLKQQLNQELVDQYLALFDEFLESHHQVKKKKDGSAKRTSLNSVKVLKICTQINGELTQIQKVVVLIRLIEFINSNEEINDQELEFVNTVAETFNIESREYKSCIAFVRCDESQTIDAEEILVVSSEAENKFKLARHIYSDGITGELRILRIASVNMYALRYFGTSSLNLNGQGIKRETVYILTHGSSIRSSKVKPIYYSDIISSFLSDKSKAKITFSAKNLEYKFKGGQLGLRNINITEDSGKLIGIMGGSGAGKSTLLNVLNSSEVPSEGGVFINGINIHSEKQKIEGVIGHISQDDLLIEELTVAQNLFYNAKLCFGNLSDHQITKMVLDLLGDLGLSETRDLKVGSPLEKTISGGQRKRLNIALELIREPAVLFVDEPTSGLSSRDSENIMDLLKELALKGKLVFVVIHQPSSEIFKMFDKLMILDVGGYPIYYGNPVDAVIYFKTIINHVNSNESECITCGNVNPELIFNIIESKVLDEFGNLTNSRKVSSVEWNKFYIERIENKMEVLEANTTLPESTLKIPSKFKQFKIFITRDILSKLTNKQYLAINLIESPLLAFILAYLVKFYNTDASNKVGYIFRENDNMPAYLFMSVVVALFIGLTVSAEEIIRDRKILKRESFLNLSRISYLFSKISIMFLLSAIQTTLFVLVGNSVLEIKGMFLDYFLVLFTTSCFANMLGLNISASFNSAVTIYILIPFLIIPQLLLSGVIVKFDKLNPAITSQSNVPFTGEIMASRWAFEALAVNQFKSNLFEKNFYKYDKALWSADFKKNYWLPKIRAKIDRCEANLKVANNRQELTDDLHLISSEIKKESVVCPDILFSAPEQLTPDQFTSATIVQLRDYTTKLNSFYIRKYNNASDQRDQLIARLTGDDKNAYLQKSNDYENESLSNLVTNHNELSKILEENGELIQRADPVYLDPTSNFARAHFFAPRKKFMGTYYDTFWVNIIVIWMMSLIMAITLYFDILKKLLDGLGQLAEKFQKKSMPA
jgi:ABC-type multidrug transport system ATPase subunit